MEKRYKGIFVSSLVIAMVATTVICNTKVLAKDRLSGVDRYETSVAISSEGWKEGAEYVVIASGEDYADALCAAPLARAKGAPILLTSRDTLKNSTIREIQRLKAPNIIIVGGAGAVSKKVEKQLNTVKGVKSVKRIYGTDRYETSLKIAQQLGEVSDLAVVTGRDYADALSIAPIAAQKGIPILMVPKDNIKPESFNYVKSIKNLENVYIIGGDTVVSKTGVEDKFSHTKRLYGSDRYATNVEIMKEFKNELNFQKLYLARGNGPKKNEFADALAGSVLAAKYNAPVILVGDNLSENTKNFLMESSSSSTEITFLGGEEVISSSLSNHITINSEKYNQDSKVYGSDKADQPLKINDNVLLNGKNATLQNAEVLGNVYVEKDGSKLKNVKVSGILYVNQTGEVVLENVQAKEIRVLNASPNSVHLKNITCDKLIVEVKHQGKPTIKVEGNNKVGNTIISSSAIVEVPQGGLGKINIQGSSQKNKVVELKGKFEGEITVNSPVSLKAHKDSEVRKVIIASGEKEKVKLEGKYNEVKLITKTNVELGRGAEIKEMKVEGKGKESTVEVPKDTKIEKADEGIGFIGEGAKEVGKIVTPTPGGSTTWPTPTPDPVPVEKPMKASVSVDGLKVKLQIENVKYSPVEVNVFNKETGKVEWSCNEKDIKDKRLIKEFEVKKPGTYYAVVTAGTGEKAEKITTKEFVVKDSTPVEDPMKASVTVDGLKVKLQIENVKYSTVTIKVINKANGEVEWIDQVDNIKGAQVIREFSVKKQGTYYAVVTAGTTEKSEIAKTEDFVVKDSTPVEDPMKASVTVDGLKVKLQIDNVKYSTVTIKVINKANGEVEWIDQVDNIKGAQVIREFSVKKQGTYYAVVTAGTPEKSEIAKTDDFAVKDSTPVENPMKASVSVDGLKVKIQIDNVKYSHVAIKVINKANGNIEWIDQIDDTKGKQLIQEFQVKEPGTYYAVIVSGEAQKSERITTEEFIVIDSTK